MNNTGKTIKTLSFNYTIRRSQRAQKIRIIVSLTKIEVVAPLLVSNRKIHAFVESKQDWVVSAAEKIEIKKQAVKKLAPEKFVDGVNVPFYGKQTKLWVKRSLSEKVELEFNDREFSVYLPEKTIETKKSECIRIALTEWLKIKALNDVEVIVESHAKKYNLYPRHIRIKTQKSRWGSCGIHNDMNLNWLLILAPPEVMEYVVVHELCHIRERNHSTKFWQLVEAHLPNYQRHRYWLKKNGSSLMLGL